MVFENEFKVRDLLNNWSLIELLDFIKTVLKHLVCGDAQVSLLIKYRLTQLFILVQFPLLFSFHVSLIGLCRCTFWQRGQVTTAFFFFEDCLKRSFIGLTAISVIQWAQWVSLFFQSFQQNAKKHLQVNGFMHQLFHWPNYTFYDFSCAYPPKKYIYKLMKWNFHLKLFFRGLLENMESRTQEKLYILLGFCLCINSC